MESVIILQAGFAFLKLNESARAYVESPGCIEGRFFLLFPAPRLKVISPALG
ncbi:hypothetical protein C7421_10730 [Pantoea ananatis]|nr:hypothetical protein C7421_10730 [Pantoea ananatis]